METYIMSDLRTVIHNIRQKDHWEMLNELSFALGEASENIITIRNEFEKIVESRQNLPKELTRAFVMIEAIKVKLSIMPEEWNKVMEETLKKMEIEYKPKEEEIDEYEF